MDVSKFRAQITGANGLARLNRFQVVIPVANLTANSTTIANAISDQDEFPTTDATDWMGSSFASGSGEVYRLTAFCEKTEIPGYQFQTDNQRIYGPSFKFAHMPEWGDITMSFLVGGDYQEKYFFDAWMYMVMDPESNNFNYRQEYAVDIDIVSYDEADKVNYTVTLSSAYPISMASLPLAYDDNNSVAHLQVTFTYKYARQFNGASGSTAPRGDRLLFQSTITPPSAS